MGVQSQDCRNEIPLNVLINKEDNEFIAHCLEFDIVTSGVTIEEAQDDILELIKAHISFCFERNDFDHFFRPAPQEFWQKYLKSHVREPRNFKRPFIVNKQRCINNVNFGEIASV